MPFYVFKCFSCNQVEEVLQKMNEDHIGPLCFKCKKVMERVFTPTPTHFHCMVPGKEVKIDRHIRDVEEAMREGFTSPSEEQEGIEQSKERARRKGIPEHRLTGETPKKPLSKTSEEKKTSKEILKKKAENQLKLIEGSLMRR